MLNQSQYSCVWKSFFPQIAKWHSPVSQKPACSKAAPLLSHCFFVLYGERPAGPAAPGAAAQETHSADPKRTTHKYPLVLLAVVFGLVVSLLLVLLKDTCSENCHMYTTLQYIWPYSFRRSRVAYLWFGNTWIYANYCMNEKITRPVFDKAEVNWVTPSASTHTKQLIQIILSLTVTL